MTDEITKMVTMLVFNVIYTTTFLFVGYIAFKMLLRSVTKFIREKTAPELLADPIFNSAILLGVFLFVSIIVGASCT